MDRQELILWEIIILCCLGIAVFPYLYLVYHTFGFLVGALVFLAPLMFWHFSASKIAHKDKAEKMGHQTNISSINLGVFCGLVAGKYVVVFLLLSRFSLILDSASYYLGDGIATALVDFLSMLSVFDVIPPGVFCVISGLFLIEVVAVISLYLAKKNGLGALDKREYLKKNILAAIILFGVSLTALCLAAMPYISLLG